MKPNKTLVIAAVGALGLGAATVAASIPATADGRGQGWHKAGYDHGWRDGHRRGMRGDRGDRRMRAMRLFEVYDTDGDRRITMAEIETVRGDQFRAAASDPDTGMTLEEFQAFWLDRHRERMVDAFQALDADGDGIITLEEFGEPAQRMATRLDRNGDGVIERTDRPRRGERGERRRSGGPGPDGAPPAEAGTSQ